MKILIIVIILTLSVSQLYSCAVANVTSLFPIGISPKGIVFMKCKLNRYDDSEPSFISESLDDNLLKKPFSMLFLFFTTLKNSFSLFKNQFQKSV